MHEYLQIFLHLDKVLEQAAAGLGPGPLYALLFAIIFCETGLVVTPFLPGDSLLFAVGALIATGKIPLSLAVVLPLLFVAGVVGDALNYAIGRKVGPAVFNRESSWLFDKKNLVRAQAFYERYGGKAIVRRRKADDEHLIRQALLDLRVIDAVISLPLNVFYGAGVPACLLILRKSRPAKRRDQVLLVYAARHFRELSNQNELRPQDVMRILVHYHAYGDAAKVPKLVKQHSGRIRQQIVQRETEEIERLQAEYQPFQDKLAKVDTELAELRAERSRQKTKADQKKTETAIHKLESQRAKPAAKLAERDERVAETRRRAEDDRREVARGRGADGSVRRSWRTAQTRPRH